MDDPIFAAIETHRAAGQGDAAAAVAGDIIPVPYVMVGATDSRNFRAISNGVVNFCPITDGKGYHGIDERLPIKDFQRAIQFYTMLING